MDIWQEWKRHYEEAGIDSIICKDGVVNEQKFRRTRPRILFVIKEVVRCEDLTIVLRENPRVRMLRVIAEWAAGMLNDFPPYEQLDDRNLFKESLERIAVICLKKVSYAHQSADSIINAFSHLDRYLLLEQIREIQPELVLACDTFDQLIWILDLKVDPEAPHKEPAQYKNALVIPWEYHAKLDKEGSYNELKELMGKIRKGIGSENRNLLPRQ